MGGVNKLIHIIEKARSVDKQKSGMLAYWSKINDNFILNYVNISFLKKDRNESISLLIETQNEPGFIFWADSEEGEKFYEDNYLRIIKDINGQQIKPWLQYEYKIKKSK
jgi:hypothetical protein